MKHPDGVVIIAGDFNHTDLKTVMPKNNTLDESYMDIPTACTLKDF